MVAPSLQSQTYRSAVLFAAELHLCVGLAGIKPLPTVPIILEEGSEALTQRRNTFESGFAVMS